MANTDPHSTPFPDELPTVLQEDAQRSLQAAQDFCWACHVIDDATRTAAVEAAFDRAMGEGRR